MQSIYGVYADDNSNTLWACSNDTPPTSAAPVALPAELHAFDLGTGEPKGKYTLPVPGAMCNDITVDSRGTTYVVDSSNMQIASLPAGAKTLKPWSAPGAFGSKGGVLDGIAVVGGTVFVNTLTTSKLFSVAIEPDGRAGSVVEVQLDRALDKPDGMRAFGKNQLLVVETGPGRLSKVTLHDGGGKVETLREGFTDNPVAVTVVGETSYVVEAQFKAFRDPTYSAKPFKATAVPVGKP